VHGAFLDQIDEFDAAFFGISPREAAALDPRRLPAIRTARRSTSGGSRSTSVARNRGWTLTPGTAARRQGRLVREPP
jgi:hypothetical protein